MALSRGNPKIQWLWNTLNVFPCVSPTFFLAGRPLTWRWVALAVCLPAASHPGSCGFWLRLWVVSYVFRLLCLPIFRVCFRDGELLVIELACYKDDSALGYFRLHDFCFFEVRAIFDQYCACHSNPWHVEHSPRPNWGIVTPSWTLQNTLCGKSGGVAENWSWLWFKTPTHSEIGTCLISRQLVNKQHYLSEPFVLQLLNNYCIFPALEVCEVLHATSQPPHRVLLHCFLLHSWPRRFKHPIGQPHDRHI